MKTLNICPSTLAEGYNTYSPAAIKTLFDGKMVTPCLDFSFEGDDNENEITEDVGNVSVSGVQEKFGAVVNDGKITLKTKGAQSTHILKPAPFNFGISTRKQIPANEHLTMQIASQVYGIETAANGLCFASDGNPVYITKRFDVMNNGRKLYQEDFASLIGKNEQTDGTDFKYNGTYEDIAVTIKRCIPAWPVAMEKFFKLVVFNHIYGNGDDHLKNFSLLNSEGEYTLAPAYDLMNTSLHVMGDDLGLNGGLSNHIEKSDTYDNTGHPCIVDFYRFALQIGLTEKRSSKVLSQYLEVPELTKTLISRSYLNDKMKRSYLRIVEERISRFRREMDSVLG